MSQHLQTARTHFIDTAGIRFAYRRFGTGNGAPLVFLQHFTGTMDSWDPAVVNALATGRTVIVFDNRGVGGTSGATPDDVESMATDAEAFITALALGPVDLLGFSLGGFVAQAMAERGRVAVRRLILAGTAPRGGQERLLSSIAEAASRSGTNDIRLPLFFTSSTSSQAAGRAFLDRASARVDDRDPDSSPEVRAAQSHAILAWCRPASTDAETLRNIAQPTLVVHGSSDAMLPVGNAYDMFKGMPNATLILYPDAGHGALFQVPDTFVAHAQLFLEA